MFLKIARFLYIFPLLCTNLISKNDFINYEYKKGVGIDHHNKKQEYKIKIMHLPAVANLRI